MSDRQPSPEVLTKSESSDHIPTPDPNRKNMSITSTAHAVEEPRKSEINTTPRNNLHGANPFLNHSDDSDGKPHKLCYANATNTF